jgi:hypothetical protein
MLVHRQLYQAPKSDVDDDSDDGARETQDPAQVPAVEEEEEEEEEEAAPVVAAPVMARRRMSMEEVCEEVSRSRLLGVQVHETMRTDNHKDRDSFFGDEEDSEEPKDGEDDDDLDEHLEQWDQNGPATVPPEMVYIFISSMDMHKVLQDEKHKYAITERILTECAFVLGCPYEILSINSVEGSLITVSKTGEGAMILGQQLQMPHQNNQYKAGDKNYDKDTQRVAIRVGLLIHIRGTGGVLSANRVKMWQREKAEWLDESFANHQAQGTWDRYSFLRNTLKIELAGPWNLERDCKLTREGTGQTFDKQIESIEETRAIWSQRFMRRYGNPLLMVLSQKERSQVVSSKNQRISASEAEMAHMFHVRKKLNVLEDGPRLFIIDIARRCIENRTVVEEQEKDAPKNKIGSKKGKHSKNKAGDMTSKLRNTLRFQDFKLVEPHPTRDTRVTIKFKTMQRDYVFDFASPREREVFMMKMKLSLPETVFASTDVQVTDQLRPSSYTENRVSDLCVFQSLHSCSLMAFLFFVLLFSSPLASPLLSSYLLRADENMF